MDTVTSSEIIGELRRASRLYEVYKRADDMLTVLVNYEQAERDLQSRVNAAEQALERVEKKAKEVAENSARDVEAAKAEARRILNEAAAVRAQANDVSKKVRADAAATVAQTKEEVLVVRKELENIKKEYAAEVSTLKSLAATREAMVAEMQSKRDQLLKAFS
jgi:DNA repair exonuclease SbcCD ATPase subunit